MVHSEYGQILGIFQPLLLDFCLCHQTYIELPDTVVCLPQSFLPGVWEPLIQGLILASRQLMKFPLH
ncbi:MAG: hypothetical protein AAGI69_05815 [Cyanobacteria bacterium P01_H01_bin.21]